MPKKKGPTAGPPQRSMAKDRTKERPKILKAEQAVFERYVDAPLSKLRILKHMGHDGPTGLYEIGDVIETVQLGAIEAVLTDASVHAEM